MFANSWRHTRTHLSIIRFDKKLNWTIFDEVMRLENHDDLKLVSGLVFVYRSGH